MAVVDYANWNLSNLCYLRKLVSTQSLGFYQDLGIAIPSKTMNILLYKSIRNT